MDTTQTVTHVSHCAGYEGIGLGLKRVIPGLRTIAYGEIEAFALANLVAKIEAGQLDVAPLWTDIKTFPFAEFHGLVDIYSAGFPCQPFSAAGKRGADEDPRHLFPHIKRGIEQMRPAVVFLENVEGIISAKLAGDGWEDPAGTPVLLHVKRELERVGYRAEAGIFSASEVGAPHQRKRVFITAYRYPEGLQGAIGESLQRVPGEPLGHRDVADTHRCGRLEDSKPAELWAGGIEQSPGDCGAPAAGQGDEITGGRIDGLGDATSGGADATQLARQWDGTELAGSFWPSRPGERQHGWEPPRVVNNSGDGRRKGRAEHAVRSGWDAAASAGESGAELADDGDSRNGDWSGDSGTRGRSESPDSGAGLADTERAERREIASAGNVANGTDAGREETAGGIAQHCGGNRYADIERADAAELADTLRIYGSGRGDEIRRGRGVCKSGQDGGAEQDRQVEPPLGGNADGIADRLDYAELCESCDSRVDELRLLGNGVVPATAERAFRVLSARLLQPHD